MSGPGEGDASIRFVLWGTPIGRNDDFFAFAYDHHLCVCSYLILFFFFFLRQVSRCLQKIYIVWGKGTIRIYSRREKGNGGLEDAICCLVDAFGAKASVKYMSGNPYLVQQWRPSNICTFWAKKSQSARLSISGFGWIISEIRTSAVADDCEMAGVEKGPG